MGKKRSEERDPQVVETFYEMINQYTSKSLFSKKSISESWDDDTLRCGIYYWNKFYAELEEEKHISPFPYFINSIATRMWNYCMEKGLNVIMNQPSIDYSGTFNIELFMRICKEYVKKNSVPEYNKKYEEILTKPFADASAIYSIKEINDAQKYKKEKLLEQKAAFEVHIEALNKKMLKLNEEIYDYRKKIDAIEAEIEKI